MIEDELNELAKKEPKFKLYHTLTRHDEAKHGKWEGLVGRVSEEMLK